MTQLFPNKLKNLPHAVQFIDELFSTYISILIMEDRTTDAILMLDHAERICRYLNMSSAAAKLTLISLSIEIKNRRLFDTQRKLAQCESVFTQALDRKGVAET